MAARPIRYISVCAGAGGLDLAVELACEHLGLGRPEPLLYLEREISAARILAARMQDGSLRAAHIWSDLTTFDARELHGKVDLVIGGLPCQPFSVAGQQRGADDERFIWPDFCRILNECRAPVVFLENVPPFVSGGHFRTVGEELSRMGYQIEDPLFVAAEDVGLPHKRERVFVMAHRGREHFDIFKRPQRLHESSGGRGELAHREGFRWREGWTESAGIEGRLDAGFCGGELALARRERDERRGVSRIVPCATGEIETDCEQRQRGRDTVGGGKSAMDDAQRPERWPISLGRRRSGEGIDKGREAPGGAGVAIENVDAASGRRV